MERTMAQVHQSLVTALEADQGMATPEQKWKLMGAVYDSQERPTNEECELMVFGGPEGEVPADLSERFPKISAVLNEIYT